MLVPAVDVYETGDHIELRAELPGMKPEDVRIDITDNTVTVSGERKLEHEEKREDYQRIECEYGSFLRSFTLPRTVDKEKIDAEMKEGVLVLTIPKVAEEKKRHIPIRSLEAKEGEKKELEKPAVEAAPSP
ncbi:MAG: Hsp20/alpha crystallin family protein [Sandaracinaceae bacterium]|nr:Hsp20/alpha crystallin family protein [Sandaracinaceae bacterium]